VAEFAPRIIASRHQVESRSRFRLVAPIDNGSLEIHDVPAPEASDDAMLEFSATFSGYDVWGGVEPCGLVANEVDRIWNESATLPSSLTLLRTALFFEARRERFVDYGGFSDDPHGVLEHRRYMRLLLDEIPGIAGGSDREAEDETVVSWLETHAPAGSAYLEHYAPDPAWPDMGPPSLEDDHVAAAVALAARMLAVDLRADVKVTENRLRDRLCLAFEHVAPVTVERERGVPVPGFQGVGPVDVLLHDYTSGVLASIRREGLGDGGWG
jgi:hypothetical protein